MIEGLHSSSRAPTLIHGVTRGVEYTLPNGEGMAGLTDGFLSCKLPVSAHLREGVPTPTETSISTGGWKPPLPPDSDEGAFCRQGDHGPLGLSARLRGAPFGHYDHGVHHIRGEDGLPPVYCYP